MLSKCCLASIKPLNQIQLKIATGLGNFPPAILVLGLYILVKFIRISDATSILSKRSSLSCPHVVKPDMPREQRERESVLLRERWHLIQSGVHRSNIKINDNRLFVGKKLHGSVVDNKFHLVQNEQCSQHKQRETDHSDNSTPTTATAQSCRNVRGTVNPGSAIVQESTPATNTTFIHSPDPNTIVDPPVPPPLHNHYPTK